MNTVCGKPVELPNLSNLQDVFNYVSKHLLTQGVKSQIDYNKGEYKQRTICAYRGQDNTCCAVGCLIPDSEYVEHMEDMKATCLDMFSDLPKKTTFLFNDLQKVHDIRGVAEWPSELNKVADKHGLEGIKL